MLETGVGVEVVRDLKDQTRIEFEFCGLRKFLDAAPAGYAVDQSLRAANDGDAAMAALIEMLESQAASRFVIDHHGTDFVAGNFPTDRSGGNFLLVEIGKDVDIDEKPVGDDDQPVDVTFEKHFEIALESLALVVRVSKNWQITERVKSVFDAPENRGAEGIGDVGQHDPNALAAAAAKKTRHGVRAVAQALGGLYNALTC